MFTNLKIIENDYPDRCSYSRYGVVFASRSDFSLLEGSMGKEIIIFGVDMSSSVHTDNKKKDILILGIGPTQELDDTMLTAEAQYSINFSRPNRKFCLSLHYNGSNSFLFINTTKKYLIKAKDSEIKKYFLSLRNILKDFTGNNMKKPGLNGYVYKFSVDYNIIDTSNVINVHKFLTKKHNIK